MGKYEPLQRFLTAQWAERLPMTFSEIESVLGLKLPNSSRTHRAWWSNNPSNNVMTEAWLAAGYETADVDLASEKLLFRRVRKPRESGPISSRPADATAPLSPTISPERASRGHPGFGSMKGLLSFPADLDLTLPADPEWGAESSVS